MRIRKYDDLYGHDYPGKLLPFKVLRRLVLKVDEGHFESKIDDALSDIRQILMKHYYKESYNGDGSRPNMDKRRERRNDTI